MVKSSKNIKILEILATYIIIMLIVFFAFFSNVYADEKQRDLLVLMYHNIIGENDIENDYEVRVSTIEKDIEWLYKNGYTFIGIDDLYNIENIRQDKKLCMLTFDDGYYSYLKYLPNIIEKYGVKVCISVVGEFLEGYNLGNGKIRPRCSYLTYNELKKLSKVQNIDIMHHSYDYHHNTKKYKGIAKSSFENEKTYEKRLTEDTKKLENKLKNNMIKLKGYTYPYGAYSKSTREILENLGYKVFFTCNEKINQLSSSNGPFVLGRYNRSGKYESVEEIVNKLAKK